MKINKETMKRLKEYANEMYIAANWNKWTADGRCERLRALLFLVIEIMEANNDTD